MAENETKCERDIGCEAVHGGERTRVRSDQQIRQLVNRLSRIEGQVRGLRGMVEKNAYCPDIMVQVSAVVAALNAFNRELLEDHIQACVSEGIRQGNDGVMEELDILLRKLVK